MLGQSASMSIESEHDVVLLQLCCLIPTNDGSVGTNGMPAALERTQKKNTSCSKTEITVVADGPAGDWLLVNLCKDAKGCVVVLLLLTSEKTSLLFFDDA